MSRCAVVRIEDKVVVNIIVADAAIDVAPLGCYLINTEGECDIGWIHDPRMNDFSRPVESANQGSE
jgi:hypothetical protein